MALDWFVFQTELQDQTFWSVLRTAQIFHVDGGEKLVGPVPFKKAISTKKGVDEQLSVRLFVASETGRYAYGSKSRPESERVL